MTARPDILCIGAVLWDIVGRSPAHLTMGSDVPGRITRLPGGVAMNIAVTLARFGMRPGLLAAIGRDAEGEALVSACGSLGLITDHIYRSDDLPTDRYMAVEGANGLVAAIADAHSLEAAGAKILRPLSDGSLGSSARPWNGPVALDGNLTQALLAEIAGSGLFAAADLRIAPASPGKAERLLPLLPVANATIYVNREEAELICQRTFGDARAAAEGLLARGTARMLVTDGGRSTADGSVDGVLTAEPPPVLVTRVTGAGDAFMAAHIAAETRGESRADALQSALEAAAHHVSGDIGS
ncbi:Pseudouridine kinase [Defluviimonas aquaemixtae]|uniref:Pseudouridine kinase n=1 Tax=Albidovulum aquaemixtae TaxID=1542388 RepID=A0A2R8B5A5_9RHOB|nr:PfkB family carbohydrate kinase [Defluviimonas aquaemixtae]SPH17831.1 Pseudouridine kinase [Defluviimonas aquaemixtae]